MSEFSDLCPILDRLAAGTYSDTDIQMLCDGMQRGQIVLADGERAVAVGGDVNDAVIITGDVVFIFKGPDGEAIRLVVQQVMDSSRLPTLLTHHEFSGRAEQAALANHQGALIGREAVLEDVKAHLTGPTRVIVLHGAGGIGKTRLLLALPDVIPEGTFLWYVRTETESIERDLAAIDRNRQHVIVVDDTHRFGKLPQLHEFLVNPELAGKVKIVLATRSVFKDAGTYRLGSLPGDQVGEMELQVLTAADIDRILQNPPHMIAAEGVRHALVRIAEGNALIASVAARMVQCGIPIIGLTRDQVLTRYLDEIIRDLAEVGCDDRYINYLQVLAALGTLNLSNQLLREKVQQVIGISPLEEDRIVSRLVEAGLIERYWMTLKIASEVMADHILISHFFERETKRADYQRQIIEPFFPLKPKEILTTLAEAEVKGEAPEAGRLLGEKLAELYHIIDNECNCARFVVLGWLEEVAYLRSDDILAIVARIVDGPEIPPGTHHDHWLGPYETKHETVLYQAVDLLSRTISQKSLRDAISYLLKLATYRPEAREYARIRKKAHDALVTIAEFKRRKPYAVQLTLLEMIPVWLEHDFSDHLDLCLAVIQPMFSMELQSSEADPADPSAISFQRWLLRPNEELSRIRERAFDILCQAYRRASRLSERLKIARAITEVGHYVPPDIHDPAEAWLWLKPECLQRAQFFSEVVVPSGELPVLDIVSRWLRHLRRFGDYEVPELERLRQQLRDHRLYQLYRMLVGRDRWDEEDAQYDWLATEQRRERFVDDYLETLSPETLGQTVSDLEVIAAQTLGTGAYELHWFTVLLRTLAERQPAIARQLIDWTIAENLTLKCYLSIVLAGLRCSAPEVARIYAESWPASDDPLLWHALIDSYRFVEWSNLHALDWEVLCQLVAKPSPPVDRELVWLTQQFAPYNAQFAIDLLKTIAVRADQGLVRDIAMVLTMRDSAHNTWAIKFSNAQDFFSIVQTFERLPSLDDYHIQGGLDRLGQTDPRRLFDFLERRLSSFAEGHSADSHYEVIPFDFSRALASIRSNPAYPVVLRRVRDWMLRDSISFRRYAPHILKALTSELDAALYDALMEWVKAGNIQEIRMAADILRDFNMGDRFYSLGREVIRRTNDELALGKLQAAIGSTPMQWVPGRLSNFHRCGLEEVSHWLQDEDFRVRLFAKQVTQLLQRDIEREQAHNERDRRNW